jgi:hypothetical protein
MPITYDNIATTTLGSAASSITFSSIPATYTDLRLTIVGTASSAGSVCYAQFNGDTATNYSRTFIRGNGTTASSNRAANSDVMYLTNSGLSITIPFFATFDVFSYAGSTFKTSLATGQEDFNGSGQVTYLVNLWRSTSAVTSIRLFNDYNWNIGTTATLYGIKNA